MRRSDREIKDLNAIITIIKKCDVCRLALNDEGWPYIIPLNFGMKTQDDKVVLYFHGALAGKKYDLLKMDNRAAFEMDCSHKLITDTETGNCTMEYESVVGKGVLEIVSEEEKAEALCMLMQHYHQEDFSFNPDVCPITCVMKLTIEDMTGKRHMK